MSAPKRGRAKQEKRPKKEGAGGGGPRLTRALVVRIGGALFGVAVAAGVALVIALLVYSHRKGPGEGQRFLVDIPKGASRSEIAHLLAEEGVVGSERLMAFYMMFSAHGEPVAGEHLLPGGATPSEIVECLARSNVRRSAKLVVPEGFHRFAIAERLETLGITSRASFLDATTDPLLLEALEVPAPAGRGPESAEGYLFPATYEIKIDTPAREVLERLVKESHGRWKRIEKEHAEDIARLKEKLGWGRAEIMTAASMVEKEAAVDEERPIIAGVFQNRLTLESFTPRLLQSDPTTGYGCLAARSEAPTCATFEGKITGAMNRDKLNRYSTYTHEGLPPGPIASPGERSILAVLSPRGGDFLYFVAAGGGHHTFSRTLEEHNRAVHR